MINYKNDGVEVLDNVIDTFPRSSVQHGTMTTTADSVTVHGTGTFFTTEIKVGDWLSNLATYEVRKVKNIASDTVLTIDRPFSTVLSNVAVRTIDYKLMVQEVFAAIKNGDGDGSVDGKIMTNGVPYLWSRKETRQTATPNFVDPLTFDAINTRINITYVK